MSLDKESLQKQIEEKNHEIEQLKHQVKELEHKLFEEKNKKSWDNQTMLYQIIENIPYKIFVKDGNGKFIVANSKVVESHHCQSVNELLGTTDFDFFDKEDAKEYWEKEKEIIETGKSKYMPEEIFKDPDNNDERILETYKIPLHLPDGENGILGIQIDVTERKKTEKQVQKQKDEIEKSQKRIQQLFDELTENIKTARMIQEAILPPYDYIQRFISNFFILYMPLQIVSGDFYWFGEKNGNLYIVAGDCTGHGVAGAFLSLIGNNILNEALDYYEDLQPGKILDILNQGVISSLHQKYKDKARGEGMDISLIKINYDKKIIEYAGAKNSLYIVSVGELKEIKADRFSIGIPFKKNHPIPSFNTKKINFEPGSMIYMSTDGYADQIKYVNGEVEKFKYQRFRNLLTEIYDKPLKDQHDILKESIQNWWQGFEQIDDILVLGIRL